jgi:periplasmic protein TonB
MGTTAPAAPIFRWRRVHPAALLVALCLHAVVIGLLTQSRRVAPRPVSVTLSLAMPPAALQGSGARPPAMQSPARPEPVPAVQSPPPTLKAVPPQVTSPQPPPDVEPMTRLQPPARQPIPQPALITPDENAPSTPPPAPTETRPPQESLPIPPIPPLPAIRTAQPPTITRYQASRTRLHENVPQVRRSESQLLPHRTASSQATSAPSNQAPAMSRAGAPPSAASRIIASSWEGALSAWIEAHKFYPAIAQQRDEQGTVMLRFSVTRDGHVTAVVLARSSGSNILDAAAQSILRNAQVPSFPATMSQAEITLTIPIRYLLEQ